MDHGLVEGWAGPGWARQGASFKRVEAVPCLTRLEARAVPAGSLSLLLVGWSLWLGRRSMSFACPRTGRLLLVRVQIGCSLVCLCTRVEVGAIESRRDGDI